MMVDGAGHSATCSRLSRPVSTPIGGKRLLDDAVGLKEGLDVGGKGRAEPALEPGAHPPEPPGDPLTQMARTRARQRVRARPAARPTVSASVLALTVVPPQSRRAAETVSDRKGSAALAGEEVCAG